MLFQQFMASLMASAPPYHSSMYPHLPDPVLDPSGHAQYTKDLEAFKRSNSESVAKQYLLHHPLEMTLFEALSPIPTSITLLKLHALTPRQATRHDELNDLFVSHHTRKFRIELQKYDDDIVGRKEAIIKFGDFISTSLFGPDWAQTMQLKFSGRATPSYIYTDGETYDTRYQHGQSKVGGLCQQHAAELMALTGHAAQGANKGKPGDPAGTAKVKTGKAPTTAGQQKPKEELQKEMLRWEEKRKEEQGIESDEDSMFEYGDDTFDPYGAHYPYDLYHPYGDLEGGPYDRDYQYGMDHLEDYLPYDPMAWDDYDEYLDAVREMMLDEAMYSSSKKVPTFVAGGTGQSED